MEELKRNIDLLKEAEQKLELAKELISLKEKALKAKILKGMLSML